MHSRGAGVSGQFASLPPCCSNLLVDSRSGKRARCQGPARSCVIRADRKGLHYGAVAPCGACSRSGHWQYGNEISDFLIRWQPSQPVSPNSLPRSRDNWEFHSSTSGRGLATGWRDQCPLYPRKRSNSGHSGTSEKCQNRTSLLRQPSLSCRALTSLWRAGRTRETTVSRSMA